MPRIRITKGRSRRTATWLIVLSVITAALLIACSPSKTGSNGSAKAPASNDPADWAKAYPVQYEMWYATSEAHPAGLSTYKRGFDGGMTFDKLSEFPFMTVLFNGWGFGVEYNEPRGHWWMLRDQQTIDPARVKAGGACLTCKTPSSDALHTEYGEEIMSMAYDEAVALLPEGQENLGVSCIDCHDNETLDLRSRRWTMKTALADIGLTSPTSDQQRAIVCGQCHCTYSVMKEDGQSVDVNYPWQGGTWGDISIETIIANLKSDPARLEWTQTVTGFKLGFIRHPDIEFFTASSVHSKAGLECPDCHMPETEVDGVTTPDHQVMSPLKQDMKACAKCHSDSAEERKAKVIAIQDKNASLLINTGYSVASNAKLFEIVNSQVATQSAEIAPKYAQAKDHYEEAFYRTVYMGAENSMGFHNPSEGERILNDAMEHAKQCDTILREILAEQGVSVPAEIDLELAKYLTNRGTEKLGFVAEQMFTDPLLPHMSQWPSNYAALQAIQPEPARQSPTVDQVEAKKTE